MTHVNLFVFSYILVLHIDGYFFSPSDSKTANVDLWLMLLHNSYVFRFFLYDYRWQIVHITTYKVSYWKGLCLPAVCSAFIRCLGATVVQWCTWTVCGCACVESVKQDQVWEGGRLGNKTSPQRWAGCIKCFWGKPRIQCQINGAFSNNH